MTITTAGATITAFDGPDLSADGCGPGAIIDQSLGSGWESTANLVNGLPGPDTRSP